MPQHLGVYVISVAARLLDVHPQTLRNYERAGFLQPNRTEGRRRLYSVDDIEHLRRLISAVDLYGLNLTGLKMVLALRAELTQLHAELAGGVSAREAAMLRERIAAMIDLVSGERVPGGLDIVADASE